MEANFGATASNFGSHACSVFLLTGRCANLYFKRVLKQGHTSERIRRGQSGSHCSGNAAGPSHRYDARGHMPMTGLSDTERAQTCLLYTSDAADDLLCVDLGGRRIIKKKKK